MKQQGILVAVLLQLYLEGNTFCTNCNIVKPITEFGQNKRKLDGYDIHCKSCRKQYYQEHKNLISIKNKIILNDPIKGNVLREKIRLQRKHRRQTDPAYKINCNHRRRVNHALKGTSKSIETLKLLGCSNEIWKLHLESLFKDGMTWDNHGKYGWHIDHIIPIKSFNVTILAEAKIAFNYINTQPLWWYENLVKGASK